MAEYTFVYVSDFWTKKSKPYRTRIRL